jgi:hypothetical protein
MRVPGALTGAASVPLRREGEAVRRAALPCYPRCFNDFPELWFGSVEVSNRR